MAGGWDIIVRTFFADGGLSAGLAKANAALGQIQKSGPNARAGLKAVEIGARQLAFEAAGLQGGIGQLVRGLAMFGGGSALMLGVVAGIGAVTLAYNALTKDTREAAEEQKKLREELHRVAQAQREARTPGTERIAGQQEKRETRFGELNRLIEERKAQIIANLTPEQLGMETPESLTERIQADAELTRLYRERRSLGQDIRSETVSSADAAKKEADERARAAEEGRRLKLELIEAQQVTIATVRMTRANIAGFGAFMAGRADLDARARLGFQGTAGLTPLGLEAPGNAPTFANIRGTTPRFVPPDTVAKKEPFPTAAVAAAAVAALGAMQVGGTGGVISGLGGLSTALSGAKGLGALNPIGIGLTALGGVFSLFDHSQDRRQREMMEELRRIRENTTKRDMPDHVSVTLLVNGKEISGAILGDIAYGLQRMRDTNGLPVLPPS